MKRNALLNARLSGLIASMGHGDLLVIGDAGLPVPKGVEIVDLAVTRGIPSLFDVLDAVLSELIVERSEIAAEAAADLAARFRERATGQMDILSHDDFKRRSAQARAVVRTGECTAYANICLYAGVAF